jgi:hypothetical protein
MLMKVVWHSTIRNNPMMIMVCKPVMVVEVEAGPPAEVVEVAAVDVVAHVVAGTVAAMAVNQPSEKLVVNEMSTLMVKMMQEKMKEVMRHSIYLIT